MKGTICQSSTVCSCTNAPFYWNPLKQRQREGIEIAKAQGKYTGRKPIPTNWTRFGQLYGEWKSKNITGRDFMRRMDMSANTFYRRVREYEIRHGITEQTSA